MKIEYLEIKNYKQFTDLTLDLTYPKGHEKEGEPLDKICIIGQSGTGKTNLLSLIHGIIDAIRNTNYQDIRDGFINHDGYIKINYKMQNNESNKIVFTEKEVTGTTFPKQEKNYLIAVSDQENDKIWSVLKRRIDNYNNERLQYINKLSNKILNIENYEKKNFQEDIKDWENKNSNILEQISDKINEVLIRFNLQLTKIDKNQEHFTQLTFKDLSNGNIIYYNDVSTGTQNLLSTFIPLKVYNPENGMICIDEPENSFYPDIQRELTDLYMNVGENNQLIMATHSPIIASSFEPWEVVELKFDKNNQIYRELYYEEENHIDNYTLDPRMLTWTGVLTDIFDLKEDSNFSFREKKLMEYIRLEKRIKNITDKKEKMVEFEKLMKLSKLLGLSNNEKN